MRNRRRPKLIQIAKKVIQRMTDLEMPKAYDAYERYGMCLVPVTNGYAATLDGQNYYRIREDQIYKPIEVRNQLEEIANAA